MTPCRHENLTRLAEDLAVKHDLPVSLVRPLLRDVFAHLAEQLARSGEVAIRGFGTFRLIPARRAEFRHPGTGAPVPGHDALDIRFLSGRALAARCGALRGRHRMRRGPHRPKPQT